MPTKPVKNVSLYLRVSTVHNQSTDSQRAELEKFCQRHDWTILNVYADHISGAKADRPALKAMLQAAHEGKAGDSVVVYKIDRLARSTADLLAILTELQEAGVGFCSITQNIDTTTSMGRMITTFLGAVAEFERDNIVERVKTGLQNAKANGVRLGRPRIGFDAARALQLKGQGLGVRRIGQELGVSYGTVFRFFRSVTKTQDGKSGK